MTATEKYTITCSGDGYVLLWDNTTKNLEPIVALQSPLGFHHVATNRKSYLAAVGFDGRVELFDLMNLKPIEIPGMIFSD